MDKRRVEEAFAAMRAAGVRLTASRRAVVETLAATGGHVTAEELSEKVCTADPNVSVATVYRTLDTLEELGLAYHVHLGHGPATWHPGDEPHHHFVCRSCGNVVEIPLHLVTKIQVLLSSDLGCELDSRHFALTGLCRGCRARGSGQPHLPAARPPHQ